MNGSEKERVGNDVLRVVVSRREHVFNFEVVVVNYVGILYTDYIIITKNTISTPPLLPSVIVLLLLLLSS